LPEAIIGLWWHNLPKAFIGWALAIIAGAAMIVALAFKLVPENYVAWSITCFCGIISGRFALTFLRRSPRLFTVMALFTFTWTLLLLFWMDPSNQSGKEIIGVYTSFLSVYIGSLLMLHAEGQDASHKTARWQVAALILLLAVATPSIPGLATPTGDPIPLMTTRQFTILMDLFLGIIGFISVVLGVSRCFGVNAAGMIGTILIFYAAIGGTFTVHQWAGPASTMPVYAGLFSVAKLAYAAAFSGVVVYRGMPDEDRKAGLWHWIMMLLGMEGSLAGPI
jgi:hypothetical protein